MSEYRIRSTGEVKTESQIKNDNPNMSLPKEWNENVYEALGVDPVLPSSQPKPSAEYKIVVRNGAEQNSDGDWVWAWAEQEMFQEYTDQKGNVVTVQSQIAAKERRKRDELLSATDHYGLSDVTMSDAMTTYRQALRDVPQQSGFPSTITWPEKP